MALTLYLAATAAYGFFTVSARITLYSCGGALQELGNFPVAVAQFTALHLCLLADYFVRTWKLSIQWKELVRSCIRALQQYQFQSVREM